MTKERQAALAEYRQKSAADDQQRMLQGQLVDGIKRIEEALAAPAMAMAEALPGIDMPLKTGRGKGRTVAVRR
jgi:hypothetical protein